MAKKNTFMKDLKKRSMGEFLEGANGHLYGTYPKIVKN